MFVGCVVSLGALRTQEVSELLVLLLDGGQAVNDLLILGVASAVRKVGGNRTGQRPDKANAHQHQQGGRTFADDRMRGYVTIADRGRGGNRPPEGLAPGNVLGVGIQGGRQNQNGGTGPEEVDEAICL